MAHKRRNDYTQAFIDYTKSVLLIAETRAEQYWQIVIDLKRIFNMEEFDKKYTDLHDEYWKMRCQVGFEVTDEIYRKYSVIQSAYAELFKYGITHDPTITAKIEEAALLLEIPQEHAAEHIKAIEAAMQRKTTNHSTSSNEQSQNGFTFFNLNKNKNGMKTTTIVVAIVATLGTISCTTKKEIIPKNFVIPADLSGSRNDSVIEWYKNTIGNSIIPSMGIKDRLTVISMDAGSVQATDEIEIADMSQYNFFNGDAGQDAKEAEKALLNDSLSALRLRFFNRFDGVVSKRKQYSAHTDIIGAIEQAAKYQRGDHINFLIVLSDMLIDATYDKGLIDFEHGLSDTSQIQAYLGRVPTLDLTGWVVIVLTGNQPNITTEKFKTVETFWEQWFARSHADLRIYTSGAVSLLDQVIKD